MTTLPFRFVNIQPDWPGWSFTVVSTHPTGGFFLWQEAQDAYEAARVWCSENLSYYYLNETPHKLPRGYITHHHDYIKLMLTFGS